MGWEDVMRFRFLTGGLVLTALAVTSGAEPVLNRDYSVLKPAQRTDSPGKVEVIEFFSYGCPHCADLHPRLAAWAAKLPKDVVLKRVPVSFGRPQWANLAKTYYALESMGQVEKVDAALYRAIHAQRLPLTDEADISAWMGKQGVDAAAFKAAFNSFGVTTRVGSADKMSKDYRITAVPTFTVAGRYAVISLSEEQIFTTADALIAKARAEKVAAQR